MSFGDLDFYAAQTPWICPGCEKEIKGAMTANRWYSEQQEKDVAICQACSTLLNRMARLYRIFGADPPRGRTPSDEEDPEGIHFRLRARTRHVRKALSGTTEGVDP